VNPFRLIQEEVTLRLESSDYLGDIPRLIDSLGDIQGSIDRALAKAGLAATPNDKAGLSILILTPSAEIPDQPPASSAMALEITVRVTVFEVPMINNGDAGIRKHPLDVVWQIISVLHGWTPGPGRRPARFLRFDSAEDEQGNIAYAIDFRFPRAFDLKPYP